MPAARQPSQVPVLPLMAKPAPATMPLGVVGGQRASQPLVEEKVLSALAVAPAEDRATLTPEAE